jgi:hypothetical protein
VVLMPRWFLCPVFYGINNSNDNNNDNNNLETTTKTTTTTTTAPSWMAFEARQFWLCLRRKSAEPRDILYVTNSYE